MTNKIDTKHTFDMAKISGIYVIINRITNEFYIGETMDISNRWKQHLRELRNGTHANKRLQSDFIKYEEKSFEFKILQVHIGETSTKTKVDLIILESAYINKYKDKYKLYNIHDTLNGYLLGDKDCEIRFGNFPIRGSVVHKLLYSTIEWIEGVPCIVDEITVKEILRRKPYEKDILDLISKISDTVKPYIVVKEVTYAEDGEIKTRHSIIVKNKAKVIEWLKTTPYKIKRNIEIT